MNNENKKQGMNIVIAGHVDHGKSTIIGRLLADTKSLPKGKLEQVQESCRRNSKPFEYAFLLDALKDEQSQGITIDSARCFFNTRKRDYIIIDAPGHIEFLKNMVSGAARAEAALLVIDADEGVQENSRRHGYMLSMLGISQIAVAVNKMDLVNYDPEIFENIAKEYTAFLKKIDVEPAAFIPVSGREGDNIARLSANTPWYKGDTILDILDAFKKEAVPLNQPFRMPVQDVYKFTLHSDERRIVAGTIDSGRIKVDDEVVFYPSGKRSVVKTIETFNRDKTNEAAAGYAAGFTLKEQIYVRRGELAAIASEKKPPQVTTRLKVSLFWLGRKPLIKKKDYLFKIGANKVSAKLDDIIRVIDASTLGRENKKEQIERHDVAECILKLNKAIAFDLADEFANSSRFVMVDDYEISGGGIIREAMGDKQAWVRDKVMLRNYKWEKSIISPEKRAEKYNQKATLLLITGKKDINKKAVAKGLENRLFADGKSVYFLGIGNVLYGVDADIKSMDISQKEQNRNEHIRRLAEIAHIMLDAGIILIVTATELNQDDLEVIKTAVSPEKIHTIWMGDEKNTDITEDIYIAGDEPLEDAIERIKLILQDKGVIFRPW
jgi:bifunctional enzyme CysN/CysC